MSEVPLYVDGSAVAGRGRGCGRKALAVESHALGGWGRAVVLAGVSARPAYSCTAIVPSIILSRSPERSTLLAFARTLLSRGWCIAWWVAWTTTAD